MREVNEFLRKFGIKSYDSVIEKVEDSYYVIPENLKSFVKYRPSYIGKKIGFMRGNNFIPSVDLLFWMSSRSKQKVKLNSEQEWKFICGNNIQRKDLPELKSEWLLVFNSFNVCIGTAQRTDKYLRRVFDIGDLLRRERKGRRD